MTTQPSASRPAASTTPETTPSLTPYSLEVEARLTRFLELLLEANERVNLTAARSVQELRVRHLDDCLELLALPEVTGAARILDVGTGGGLPGIPLACTLPHASLILLDATRKKLAQVEGMIQALGLTNARTLCGRAEELAHHPDLRGTMDCAVSRAVAPLPSLLEYMAGFVRPGGFLVALKGSDASRELEEAQLAMQLLKTRFVRAHPYRLGELTFSLLIFTQLESVPPRYPRGQGLVRNKPLGSPLRG